MVPMDRLRELIQDSREDATLDICCIDLDINREQATRDIRLLCSCTRDYHGILHMAAPKVMLSNAIRQLQRQNLRAIFRSRVEYRIGRYIVRSLISVLMSVGSGYIHQGETY